MTYTDIGAKTVSNKGQTKKSIASGYMLDYISGQQVKETKKESVRQRIVRALIHEFLKEHD